VVADDAGKALLVAAGWINVGRVFANASLQFPSGTITWAGRPEDLFYDTGSYSLATRGKVLGSSSVGPNSFPPLATQGPWPASLGALCQDLSTGRWFWFDSYQWRAFDNGAFAGPVPTLPAS
jgi:hypothetical protein